MDDYWHGSTERSFDHAGRVEGLGGLAASLVEVGLDLRGERADACERLLSFRM
ncbi:hypothetical protein [Streptomyces flavidovirens]